MKFIYLAYALVAAVAYSQPIEDLLEVEPLGDGLIEPQLITNITTRELHKRANVQFAVFPSNNCGGSSLVITATGNGQRGDFPVQHTVRIFQLTNGFHLTLYSGAAQSGVRTRFTATEVGADLCFIGSWLSWGLFNQ